MSGSIEKKNVEEESKPKRNKELDQKTQIKGSGSSSREFLGRCFKCGETEHRSFECKQGIERNCVANEDQEVRVTSENVL